MARIDTEVDVDDMLWSMSSWEKQEMADELYEQDYIPKQLQKDLGIASERTAVTNLERDLSDLLDKIWDNKLFLNNDDIQTLTVLAKKGL